MTNRNIALEGSVLRVFRKWKTILPDLELRAAQVALMYLGMDPGPIDGPRGRRTRSALTEFQEQHGLPATGEPDDATEAKLLAKAFPAR